MRMVLPAVLMLLPSGLPLGAQIPEGLLEPLTPRMIGPSTMSGRVADLAVYEDDPSVFYVASASGGLLKTENGGASWENVFEDQPVVSIGDVAINPHDPGEVWVGTGEANNRQSSSWGDGVYKSTDGGRSWSHVGLVESHHVGRIVVDPTDTEVVYAAALGHLWGPNPERGVYRTSDGGESWEHVLAVDENTGAVDLAMDPANPKILYAATYQRRRTGWGFNGGGPGSGIYKTVDGGRSWRRLTQGLPEGPMGRIGLDVYRGDPNLLYARIEHEEEGGVYRSRDKGESWERVNELNPRPMYFSQIRIDPSDPDRIYVLGVRLHMSSDGGRTFTEESAENVHLDHHAFWIDPDDSDHIIDGNDGGVWVTRDRTATWEHLNNYPIGQFYNVAFDMREPYHVYGGMQDNATWGGPSAVRAQQGIGNEDWTQMLACDGMFVAVDPADEDLVYTNCQNGRIVRYHRPTGERKPIQPDLEGEDLRWNWTAPIVVSPHDPATIYTGANRVFRSTDRGHAWEVVSPDLTAAVDRDTLRIMGVLGDSIGLATHDGVSSFGTITALAESTLQEGLLYVGTDDGRLHRTRDGGGSWTDLSDADGLDDVPARIFVSRVWPSAFEEGRAYLTYDGHRSDDFAPHVFVTEDFGASWRSLSGDLPTGSVYVIKEDPKNPDVLYVGTEFGLFASADRGERWTRWPGVPTVAVYDLDVHPREDDLILGTHGRSIAIIDDVSPLQEWEPGFGDGPGHLFDPGPATQFIPNEDHWFQGGRNFRGPNPAFGAYLDYWLSEAREDSVTLVVRDPDGSVVRELRGAGEPGLHRVVWDLRTEGVGPMGEGLARAFDLSELGPFVVPGRYEVELVLDGASQTKALEVRGDPAVDLTAEERRTRFETLTELTVLQERVSDAGDRLDAMDEQLDAVAEMVEEHPDAPAVVTEALEAAREEVEAARDVLSGGDGDEPGAPTPLAREVGGLKDGLIHAQSPATVLQEDGMRRSRERMSGLLRDVNVLIRDTLPALYALLAEHDIHPVPGEPLAPLPGGGP